MKRRTLLAGGGALVVAFTCRWAGAQEGASAGSGPLPGSLKVEPYLDGWIRVSADGSIGVFTGKAELGQGIRTALLQIAAEELVVAPGRIALVGPDTERTANEGYTAGSHSMQDSGTAIRHAAAQVRALLLARAAQRLSVAPEALVVADGVVTGGGRRVEYADLVEDAAMWHVQAAPHVALRDPKLHTVVGRPMRRTDIPAKLSGGVAYVQDLRLPDMAHGRILRPPSAGSTLRALDTAAVESMPGVLRVVRDGRFIGVIAVREYQAVLAQRALAAAARWDDGPATLPPAAALYASLRTAKS